MKDGTAPGPARILYCNCTYSRILPEEVKSEVLSGLVRSGAAFDAVPDLCELAAQGDPSLVRLAAGGREIRIAACYPRAVQWLFHRAGSRLPEDGVRICNMRTGSGREVLAGLFGETSPDGGQP